MRGRRVGFAVATALAAASVLSHASDGVVVSRGAAFTSFTPASFTRSTTVDNAWLPLVPGTQFVLEGQTRQGKRPVPHRLVSTVTDLTKVIDGVRTLVIWDRDYSNGVLAESELSFHAQDNSGNVWNLGEYPEEYDGGRFAGAPNTWISGRAGARAGVLMRARPRPGTSSYIQGYAPAIGFKDRAKVYAAGQRTCVPAGCFANTLVVEEWNALAPTEGHQLKYHAPGVGIVRVGPFDSTDQEALTLTQATRLGPTAMADIRAQVLRMDKRAHQIAAAVYGPTAPVQPIGASTRAAATISQASNVANPPSGPSVRKVGGVRCAPTRGLRTGGPGATVVCGRQRR
jgi:hypothetical protein